MKPFLIVQTYIIKTSAGSISSYNIKYLKNRLYRIIPDFGLILGKQVAF